MGIITELEGVTLPGRARCPLPAHLLVYTANIAMKQALLFALAVVSLVALLGCSPPPPAASVKEYQVTGEVLKLDPAAQTASLKAGKIEGWMDAMTMDFPIKDKQEFEKLKVGTTIHAKVSVQGTEYWMSGIAEAEGAPPPNPASK
jgi:Cu/Ag efflux protein CusF